jgi:hypothetical protein
VGFTTVRQYVAHRDQLFSSRLIHAPGRIPLNTLIRNDLRQRLYPIVLLAIDPLAPFSPMTKIRKSKPNQLNISNFQDLLPNLKRER